MEFTNEQLQEDIEFLLADLPGMSANSIKRIAYGKTYIKHQFLPSDLGDLSRCINLFNALPEHRKTRDVFQAMALAKQVVQEIQSKRYK